jgi:predicted flap endonuclease-1-like 5' DNA nuclease
MTKDLPGNPNSDFPKLSRPAHAALAVAGYTHLAQLAQVTEAEIAKLHGMGPKGIRELKDAMQAKGLAFKAKP